MNSFYGNLKNESFYGGLWGAFNDDNTLWWGMRNDLSFGRFDKNNPQLPGPRLEVGNYHIIAGRIGEGTGRVDLDLFLDSGKPVATAKIPVDPKANPSKMAIGQERDATEHPGKESFDSEIARFMIYQGALTDKEVATRRASLQKQYGISRGGMSTATPPPNRAH